jgi:hypothetical protein
MSKRKYTNIIDLLHEVPSWSKETILNSIDEIENKMFQVEKGDACITHNEWKQYEHEKKLHRIFVSLLQKTTMHGFTIQFFKSSLQKLGFQTHTIDPFIPEWWLQNTAFVQALFRVIINEAIELSTDAEMNVKTLVEQYGLNADFDVIDLVKQVRCNNFKHYTDEYIKWLFGNLSTHPYNICGSRNQLVGWALLHACDHFDATLMKRMIERNKKVLTDFRLNRFAEHILQTNNIPMYRVFQSFEHFNSFSFSLTCVNEYSTQLDTHPYDESVCSLARIQGHWIKAERNGSWYLLNQFVYVNMAQPIRLLLKAKLPNDMVQIISSFVWSDHMLCRQFVSKFIALQTSHPIARHRFEICERHA